MDIIQIQYNSNTKVKDHKYFQQIWRKSTKCLLFPSKTIKKKSNLRFFLFSSEITNWLSFTKEHFKDHIFYHQKLITTCNSPT